MNTNTKTTRDTKASAPIANGEKDAGTSPAPSASPPFPRPDTKIGKVIALLERKEGATIEELTQTTGWLPHTVRASLTGLKKKGHVIAKSKRDDITCYRITGKA